MTEQEKTFISREFDKLENQLNSNYALYKNGYQSALFDALEVVNKLPIYSVIVPKGTLVCKNCIHFEVCNKQHKTVETCGYYKE